MDDQLKSLNGLAGRYIRLLERYDPPQNQCTVRDVVMQLINGAYTATGGKPGSCDFQDAWYALQHLDALTTGNMRYILAAQAHLVNNAITGWKKHRQVIGPLSSTQQGLEHALAAELSNITQWIRQDSSTLPAP